MSTNDTTAPDRGPGCNDLLGLVPKPVAYLYHDASTPEDAHPWLHSTMLVLAADRRPGLRGETALVTLAQAEAMVAAERERERAKVRFHLERTTMSVYSTRPECKAARDALQRLLDDEA